MEKKIKFKLFVIKTAIVMMAAMLMGLAVSMFYRSGLGSDPVSTFLEALSILFGVRTGTMSMIFNITVVVIFFKFKRELISFGTVIQTFMVGFGINLGMSIWSHYWLQFQGADIMFDLLGSILVAVSLALYLPLEFGASPIDIIILTVCGLIKKSYKWGFHIVYGVAFISGVLLGGTWGIGTIIAFVVTGQVADRLIPLMKKVYDQILYKGRLVNE